MEFRATTVIDAPPEVVWGILTDAEGWPAWEPNVTRIEGRIAPGERITVRTRLSDRAFPATVEAFAPSERMVWASGMPLGLFRGARTFTLEPVGGGTRVTTHERFSGLLLPLIGRTIPDLQPAFDQFAAALKAEAERRAG